MAAANDFVNTASGEVGNGPSKYNTGGAPWCAIFVNWCLKQCGDGRQRDARACSFADMGSLHTVGDGYTPKPGDLIIVNLKSDHSYADHVAIVKAYNSDTGKLVTINGNGGGNVVTESTRSYDGTVTVVEMEWDSETSSAPLPKIFLNPGHGKYPNGTYDSGAVGNGYKEAELTREVVRMVADNLSGYADVSVFDYEKDLYKYLSSTTFEWSDYAYFLSVHFDAGGGSGTTAYKARNRNASTVETALAEKVSAAGGFENNGVKDHPNNLAVLSASDKAQNGGTTSTLLEVCFVDNAADMQKYADKKGDIAKAISDALISGLSLTYNGSGGGWVADWQERELPNNARALKSKTYERYWKITAKGTKNYEVSCGENASTHETKLRVWKDNFLVIALGSYYGECGTFVKIQFDNGVELICIKGDEKDDRETNTDDPPHSYHVDGPGYVENKAVSCNLLEVQADVQGSDWQGDFQKALDAYTGAATFDASITAIWTSSTEPVWRDGNTAEAKEKEPEFEDTNEKIPLHNSIFNMPDMAFSNNSDIAVYVGLRNIAESVGTLSWTNTKAELATTVTFSAAKTDNEYEYMYLPQKGEIMRLFLCGNEVYRGVIISDDTGNRHSNSYTAADPGYYLNKTTDTYQFKDIPSVEALKKICDDLSIPIAYIDDAAMEGSYISELYIDKNISEVIWDIIDRIKGDWTFDFVPSGIRIYKIGTYVADPKFRMSPNTELKSSIEYRGVESVTSSIEDRKTAIKIISDTNVLASARNDDSYNRFGFLQEVIKLDDENTDPLAYAEEQLNVLNRETSTRNFPMQVELGDYTRAGDCLCIDNVWYQITSAQHEIKSGRHTVTVELERID